MKLKFIIDFKKEGWFIENKYKEAIRLIGRDRFAYIINQNVPGGYSRNTKTLRKKLAEYFRVKEKYLSSAIKQKGGILEKRWKRVEEKFSRQSEIITGVKWKYKIYEVYLLHSCFWGGDYDIGQNRIYINPL